MRRTRQRPVAGAMHPHKGFSLIELMIVVSVIAILAGIAVPGYQAHMQRAHRAEARAGLLQAAQWLERVATATGLYLADEADFPNALKSVPSGTYAISFATPDKGRSYILHATPMNAQADDKCGSYVLTPSGERRLGAPDAPDALVAECWNR